MDEIWEAFETQVRSGKVDYIGSSNFAGWHLVKAQAEAEKRRFMDSSLNSISIVY